ncbi:DUF3105 domain-containing protein [Leptolyngbya sp. BC1307]|uniref:DUF3105 domain-containing protein n=1 Tax=Leptolyngbya sp. BC1307 TaxID=2029589 RepID=UPI000EFCC0CF|nr:DUF3105 domain-containing protein [Leptolyngbya sp. BC1307]
MNEQLKNRANRARSRRRTSNRPNFLKVMLGPVGLAVFMIGLIAILAYRNRPDQVAFEPNTAEGEAALTAVETSPDEGRKHVAPGESVDYENDFPTSGPHDPTPVAPGVYSQAQRPEQLVHSLEHGNIVVYYDQPGAEATKALESWADQFPGAWDGVVVTPKAGLGESVVLTAWTKQLNLAQFNPEAAASFIDEYRGRGPENPVR